MAVYFVCDESGRVKIGRADNVAERVLALQCANADALTVERTVDGGELVERWLHDRYAAFRIRGEWFTWRHEMLTVEVPSEQDLSSGVGAIFSLWPSIGHLASDLGVEPQAIRKWRKRGSIPARYWLALCNRAKARGIKGVSLDALARCAAEAAA